MKGDPYPGPDQEPAPAPEPSALGGGRSSPSGFGSCKGRLGAAALRRAKGPCVWWPLVRSGGDLFAVEDEG